MTTATKVDPKDVETVLALEPKVREFVRAVRHADAAFKRLEAAGYAGADALRANVHNMLEDGDSTPDTGELLAVFKLFHDARGDQGAYDYLELCVKGKRSIEDAVVELVDCYGPRDAQDHIDRLWRYAASVAR